MAEVITLKASGVQAGVGTVTGSTVSSFNVDPGNRGIGAVIRDLHNSVIWELDVTAAADDADDTLNVAIETLIGATWVEIVAFTEVLGNGSALTHIGKTMRDATEAMFLNAALAAGNVRNIIGSDFRYKAVIVDPTGADATFTFSVTGRAD